VGGSRNDAEQLGLLAVAARISRCRVGRSANRAVVSASSPLRREFLAGRHARELYARERLLLRLVAQGPMRSTARATMLSNRPPMVSASELERHRPRNRRRKSCRATPGVVIILSNARRPAPIRPELDYQRHHCRARAASHGEGGDEVVLVVENLDVQRQRVGMAADVAGDDRHGAELAHRAGVAEDDAVEQAPADLGQRDAQERHPGAGTEGDRGLLLVAALLLHERYQLACHVGKRHEDGGEHDARHREHDLDVALLQPGPEPAVGAEQHDEDEAGDDRRDRKRQVDQCDEQALAAELELRDRPGRADAEDRVDGDGDRRRDQRKPDRGAGVCIGKAPEVGCDALCEGLRHHGAEGRDQQQAHEGHGDSDQRDATEAHRVRDAPPLLDVPRQAGHQRPTATWRRRPQVWTRLMANSIANEISSMIKPSAAAA
jgi:hypothetical protein